MSNLIACRAIFFVLAFYVGNWTIRIPDIKNQVDTGYGGMGLNGMAFAVGAILIMIISSSVIRRLTTKRAIYWSAWVIAIGFAATGFARDLPVLMLLSLITGIAYGLTEVAMNAQASNLEVIHKRSMMSGFHAFFSLGLLTGALFASGIVELNVSVSRHFFGLAIVLLPFGLFFARYLIEDRVDDGKSVRNSIFFRWPMIILVLVILAISGSLLEGAVDSWSALYMQDVVEVGGFRVGLGVVVFNIFMVIGRLVGDRVGDLLGLRKSLLIQLIMGIIASFILFQYHGFWSSILGFGLAGLGVSNLVPIAYSQAGKSASIETPVAIAIISLFSFGSFMLAPPIEGLIADLFGLPSIFLAMFFLFLLVLTLTLLYGVRYIENTISDND